MVISPTQLAQVIQRGFSESGNTLLVGPESGTVVFYRRLDAQQVFKFAYIPDNYPSVDAGVVSLTQDAQIEEIIEVFGGLDIVKTEIPSLAE
jgi:hypothetical protein